MNITDWFKNNSASIAKWTILTLCVGLIVSVIVGIFVYTNPNNHNESTYGKIKVAVNLNLYDTTDSWSSEQLLVIRDALEEAQKLGPTIIVTEGPADVTIYKTELKCNTQGVGRFIVGTRIIEIDPRCTKSNLELQTTVIHELGHFMGMGHICRDNVQTTLGGCSTIGRGPAVMNPGLVLDNSDGPGFVEVWTGPLPNWKVTELDIKEFKRAWAFNHNTNGFILPVQ